VVLLPGGMHTGSCLPAWQAGGLAVGPAGERWVQAFGLSSMSRQASSAPLLSAQPPPAAAFLACPVCPAVMTEAFQGIWQLASKDGLPLRTAAFAIALQRVARARLHRGFD
jgi:hypothetical protein